MGPKKILIALLVLLHLLSVAVFIWTDFPAGSPDPLNAAVSTYRNLSGSFKDYTYFAPSVGSDMKVGFLLEDAGGRSRLINFLADSKEINLRYGCLITAGMREESGRDLFAQSWAAFLLGSNPDMDKVTIIVEGLAIPSMEEYRQGQRPQWQMIYVGKFARRTDHASG